MQGCMQPQQIRLSVPSDDLVWQAACCPFGRAGLERFQAKPGEGRDVLINHQLRGLDIVWQRALALRAWLSGPVSATLRNFF